jgi:hypothetical protein
MPVGSVVLSSVAGTTIDPTPCELSSSVVGTAGHTSPVDTLTSDAVGVRL